MRFLSFKHTLPALFFALSANIDVQAQTAGNVQQDERFEQLLAEKRKINSAITVNDRYKVQIFYGDNEKARKTLQDFKREFKTTDGTIIFESPTYKVWVGSYKSRIEAERNLTEIRKKFPYALIVKPNK
ncbi:SPOR domain-containing protein [Flavobacterium psychrotrophum]|uniref:SPOR domain-containing protein n=1 Tax=Flavobacterium psychrotrophum TaxID=2294119 RepID=UPI000E31B65A|nr:SPOR domain-containing protein [Flavobacterium psychrotrophum]